MHTRTQHSSGNVALLRNRLGGIIVYCSVLM